MVRDMVRDIGEGVEGGSGERTGTLDHFLIQ